MYCSPSRSKCRRVSDRQSSRVFAVQEPNAGRGRHSPCKGKWRVCSSCEPVKLFLSTSDPPTSAKLWRISTIPVAAAVSTRSAKARLERLVHNGYSNGRGWIWVIFCSKGNSIKILAYDLKGLTKIAIRLPNHRTTNCSAAGTRQASY
jgi:hypothetical protein